MYMQCKIVASARKFLPPLLALQPDSFAQNYVAGNNVFLVLLLS